MNEFTKEELTTIKFWSKFYCDFSPLVEWRNKNLTDKIQSLIDNYCEHEWGEDPNDGDGWMCSKCGIKQ